MLIARIVKSNSHVDYVGRVLDRIEIGNPPAPEHYRFGQFVFVPSNGRDDATPGAGRNPDSDRPRSSGRTLDAPGAIGIIYNSQLVNPDYDRVGPRLSTPVEMNTVFSPDLLNEQGVLIGVLRVGWIEQKKPHQGIPRAVIPVNSEIVTISQEEMLSFHMNGSDRLSLHYYPHVVTHARQFAQQLLISVLDQIEAACDDRAKPEIALLRSTLNWQLVFQSKSL